MAFEKSFDSGGSGATVYVLSRCDGNNPYDNTQMPDDEGCPECDGDLGGGDFHPQSISCNVPF